MLFRRCIAMGKTPDFSELFFSKAKDFLDIFLSRQERRSRDTVKAYRISLTCFYEYVTVEKKLKVMYFKFIDCTYEFTLSYSQYL
jgi:integrase/recombinase XerD